MHLVMEHLDFAKALEQGRSYIRETVEKLRSTGSSFGEEAKAIRIDQIHGFFAGNVGKRAAPAGVFAEGAGVYPPEGCERKQAIVQGIIDCFFEEEDGMVLIDYKNSYVDSEAEEEEIRQRYEEQLALYKEALEASWGQTGQGNLPVSVSFEKIYPYETKKFSK